MAHTHKHVLKTMYVDNGMESVDITIYTSGGTLHTVEIVNISDCGKSSAPIRKSFGGKSARLDALKHAELVIMEIRKHDSI